MSQPSNTDLIELSPEAFVNALRGEKVKDLDGNKRCFLSGKQINIHKVYLEDIVMIKGDLEFKYDIQITECDFRNASIEIYSGIFMGNIGFYNSPHNPCPCGQLEIFGGVFQGKITIQSSFTDNLCIYGGEFKRRFLLNPSEVKGFVQFRGGVFHKSVFVDRGTYKKELHISDGKFLHEFAIQTGSNFHQEVKVAGGSFQELNVYGGSFNEGITFTGGEFKTINFMPKRIDDASHISKLSLNTEIKYPVFIKEYPINEIFISRLNYENGGIYLENLQLNKLTFKSFRNYGKVSIENLSAIENNSSLHIINSDLGNFLALNVNFNSFHNIIFNNSKLSKLNMYEVPIPFNSQKIFTNHKQERNHAQLADLYNQLYLAMQTQGYRDYEMKYYAAYLENHRLHLNEKKKEYSTSIALCLHKFSTNYSQNWIRGVLLAIPITLVLFYLYFIALPEFEFAYDPNRWSQVTFNLFTTHYFEFLITPYRMNFIEGTNPGSFSNIIFIFSRIVIGFFIYQTIAAFRKFGKK